MRLNWQLAPISLTCWHSYILQWPLVILGGILPQIKSLTMLLDISVLISDIIEENYPLQEILNIGWAHLHTKNIAYLHLQEQKTLSAWQHAMMACARLRVLTALGFTPHGRHSIPSQGGSFKLCHPHHKKTGMKLIWGWLWVGWDPKPWNMP